jgi:hypothetical protein
MSRFIKLTGHANGQAVHIQPDDVKVIDGFDEGSKVLLYGAAEIWIGVTETPTEVIALIEPPSTTTKAAFSSAFYGRN